jgi:hypothetical protein
MTRTRILAITIAVAVVSSAGAQERSGESAAVATELVTLLHESAMDAVATADPNRPGRFAAALLLPGPQLLAISAAHPDPPRIERAIAAGNFRQVYSELHTHGTRVDRRFIQDLQADGLRPSPEPNQAFDIVRSNGETETVYDGDWKRQHLTEQAYERRFSESDRDYAELLRLLIAAVHKPRDSAKTVERSSAE